jgi:protein-tyrosine phosphatase
MENTLLNWFKRKNAPAEAKYSLTTDLHSHLLYGLDDGVETLQQALHLVEQFEQAGYRKLITTPHIMSDFYQNSPETILPKLGELQQASKAAGYAIELEAAAEYYLDEGLVEKLKKNEPLLTFGNKHLLFELSFMNEPIQLNEVIFSMRTLGYQPVLAHPERYSYLQKNMERVEELIDRGVLLQVNIASFGGYYSRDVQKAAERLVQHKWVHLLGSDCHNQRHFEAVQAAKRTKNFQKALNLPLQNHSL